MEDLDWEWRIAQLELEDEELQWEIRAREEAAYERDKDKTFNCFGRVYTYGSLPLVLGRLSRVSEEEWGTEEKELRFYEEYGFGHRVHSYKDTPTLTTGPEHEVHLYKDAPTLTTGPEHEVHSYKDTPTLTTAPTSGTNVLRNPIILKGCVVLYDGVHYHIYNSYASAERELGLPKNKIARAKYGSRFGVHVYIKGLPEYF